jgi:hypothetical protein
MPELHHQTVRLDAGRHASPNDGMCTVELASVLAGEHFSDHPTSVCPVIAAFVRAYNDRVDDARRQDLLPYAARIVDTRADRSAERTRAARCAAWAIAQRLDLTRHAGLRRLADGHGGRIRTTRVRAAAFAARSIGPLTDETHRAVLVLLDELVALGGRASATPDLPPMLDYVRRSAGASTSRTASAARRAVGGLTGARRPPPWPGRWAACGPYVAMRASPDQPAGRCRPFDSSQRSRCCRWSSGTGSRAT